MVIFNSYVKLPEGKTYAEQHGFCIGFKSLFYLHIVRYFLEEKTRLRKTVFIPSQTTSLWLSAVFRKLR
jgi:methylase of polypeptide subunit release factors